MSDGRLDYCGIILNITAIYTAWLYLMFYCQPQVRYVYTAAIWTMAVAYLIAVQYDRFSSPDFLRVRAGSDAIPL